MNAADVVAVLDRTQLQFVSEDDLQESIRTALMAAGIPAERERRLSDGRSRIDLFANPGIGVEVKIDGSWAAVVRQLQRYAKCPEIDELILVTSRSKHHRIPTELEGKPVHLVSLIGAAL
ncbi:hypothetical protein [Curtobacterium sp. MCBD17_021]|uniref:hypothetical protein n=1 Tax=Curtobacterium sp. MCBD17_021 TaxID=2175665 RepID=UPI000DAA5ABB|nr:hypothetical protein [Curtobacterium sp. MCBD17_021]PZE66928.1 hypothetical protein DEI83_06360 [Curtobacterium sp. MCBD17_021]